MEKEKRTCGACLSCFTCEKGVSPDVTREQWSAAKEKGEIPPEWLLNTGCEKCFACQKCDVGQAGEDGCENCFTCQKCDTGQEDGASCENCFTCQKCDSSQNACEKCFTCQKCDTLQN